MTGLTPEEIAVLEACLPDGKPPRELTDATTHQRLEKLGLMNHRFGEAPGGGMADFWGTNENGVWALKLAKKELAER